MCVRNYRKKAFKDIIKLIGKQAIIKLIGKTHRDKAFIKNWTPVSLLNADLEILSKPLSGKLKNVQPDLIFSLQTAYVKTDILVKAGE